MTATGIVLTILGALAWCAFAFPLGIIVGKWFARQREAYPCGHTQRTPGCGGCDPGAIEAVYDDEGGCWRPFDWGRDMRGGTQ